LTGLKVLITRAREQAPELRQLLLPLGAEVFEIPVIEISAPQDFAELDRALSSLTNYDWLIFASKNSVKYTLARALELGLPTTLNDRPKLAAIGPATAEELAKHGLSAAFCPSNFVAENLVDEFPGYPDLAGTKILWPKTNIGRTLIIDKLTGAGATVDTALAYTTGLPADHDNLALDLVEKLATGKIDVITLASAQSAKNLTTLINIGLKNKKNCDLKTLLKPIKIAAIGPITAEAARDCLGKVDIEAEQYTLAGLTESLLASLKFPQKGHRRDS